MFKVFFIVFIVSNGGWISKASPLPTAIFHGLGDACANSGMA
jgi:hypothetical protein